MEGYRLVSDAFRALGDDVHKLKVIVSESHLNRYGDGFGDVTVMSDNIFDKISDTVSSQGIIAVADIPPFEKRPVGKFCLYLDRVRDPGNLGTIIRTAAACDFNDIILHDCVDVYNPKTIRSSMSAYAHCRFIIDDLSDDLTAGYTVLCADANGTDIRDDIRNIADKKVCLVIGNEAQGVGEDMRKRADLTVSLPMNCVVESLNAAVSASVIMYNLRYFNQIK